MFSSVGHRAEGVGQSISDILSGPGFFRCERFRCTMRIQACIDRQGQSLRQWGNSGDPLHLECQGCNQGRALAGLLPVEAKAAVTAVEKNDKVKQCSACRQEKPRSEFYTLLNAPDRLQSWCKACTRAKDKERKRYQAKKKREGEATMKEKDDAGKEAEGVGLRAEGTADVAEKQCTVCGAVKPIDAFFRDKNTKSGRKSACKICDTAKVKAWKQKQRREGENVRRSEGKQIPTNLPTLSTSNLLPLGMEITESRVGIYVDFTGREDLLKRLEERAFREFRTPSDQVLSWINTLAREVNHEAA